MLKQTISIAVMASMATLAGGCASTQEVANAPVPVDARTLQSNLASQEASIVNVIAQAQNQQQQHLDALNTQLQGLQQQMKKLQQPPKETIKEVQVPAPCEASPIGDKYILGEVESVFIDELNASFDTRIDTGAESSSLDARNIILFERDGAQWVRFDVMINGADAPGKTFESKVVRFVRIKQDADEKDDRRPVIHAHLKIGKYAAETDLNLTDRSHLEYPLLLGRKFMKDIAVVDVGQAYLHGKAKDLVISSHK
ncbi:ATP-dependent zinc protease [Shewanella algae]|uniref:ATP-dependent zinc protease family protein n=1 Tax=Shewanella algae TaxID=38313 RepID=UPI003AAEDB60